MASNLVAGQLGKVLSTFIKDYSKEKFSLALAKGNAELTNFQLNEEVVQELLDLPQLLCAEANCNLATISIPWSKLTNEPIRVSVDRLEVALMEPADPLEPSPSILGVDPSATSKKKYGFVDRLVDGIRVDVKQVFVTMHLLGPSKATLDRSATTPHVVTLVLKDVSFYPTDDQWNVVGIKAMNKPNKGKKEVVIFKEATIASASLYLVPPQPGGDIPDESTLAGARGASTASSSKGSTTGAATQHVVTLLSGVPFSVHLTFRKRRVGSVMLGLQIEAVFGGLALKLAHSQYRPLLEVLLAVASCFDRDLPPDVQAQMAERLFGASKSKGKTGGFKFGKSGKKSGGKAAAQDHGKDKHDRLLPGLRKRAETLPSGSLTSLGDGDPAADDKHWLDFEKEVEREAGTGELDAKYRALLGVNIGVMIERADIQLLVPAPGNAGADAPKVPLVQVQASGVHFTICPAAESMDDTSSPLVEQRMSLRMRTLSVVDTMHSMDKDPANTLLLTRWSDPSAVIAKAVGTRASTLPLIDLRMVKKMPRIPVARIDPIPTIPTTLELTAAPLQVVYDVAVLQAILDFLACAGDKLAVPTYPPPHQLAKLRVAATLHGIRLVSPPTRSRVPGTPAWLEAMPLVLQIGRVQAISSSVVPNLVAYENGGIGTVPFPAPSSKSAGDRIGLTIANVSLEMAPRAGAKTHVLMPAVPNVTAHVIVRQPDPAAVLPVVLQVYASITERVRISLTHEEFLFIIHILEERLLYDASAAAGPEVFVALHVELKQALVTLLPPNPGSYIGVISDQSPPTGSVTISASGCGVLISAETTRLTVDGRVKSLAVEANDAKAAATLRHVVGPRLSLLPSTSKHAGKGKGAGAKPMLSLRFQQLLGKQHPAATPLRKSPALKPMFDKLPNNPSVTLSVSLCDADIALLLNHLVPLGVFFGGDFAEEIDTDLTWSLDLERSRVLLIDARGAPEALLLDFGRVQGSGGSLLGTTSKVAVAVTGIAWSACKVKGANSSDITTIGKPFDLNAKVLLHRPDTSTDEWQPDIKLTTGSVDVVLPHRHLLLLQTILDDQLAFLPQPPPPDSAQSPAGSPRKSGDKHHAASSSKRGTGSGLLSLPGILKSGKSGKEAASSTKSEPASLSRGTHRSPPSRSIIRTSLYIPTARALAQPPPDPSAMDRIRELEEQLVANRVVLATVRQELDTVSSEARTLRSEISNANSIQYGMRQQIKYLESLVYEVASSRGGSISGGSSSEADIAAGSGKRASRRSGGSMKGDAARASTKAAAAQDLGSLYATMSVADLARFAPDRAGWLTKQGHFVKNWKRRFFAIKDNTMFYFVFRDDAQARGAILLTNATVEAVQHKRPHVFLLTTSTGVKYYIQAENSDDMALWIGAVKQGIAGGPGADTKAGADDGGSARGKSRHRSNRKGGSAGSRRNGSQRSKKNAAA